ncbi:hypothetical protein [Amycolatopsis sp. NPDC051102]|uniref:hypothetical protein n=1 Tax=Amycolatopsis sp. NPDC051102 TaxID=3155163 RepID=UPI0034339C1B
MEEMFPVDMRRISDPSEPTPAPGPHKSAAKSAEEALGKESEAPGGGQSLFRDEDALPLILLDPAES